MKRVEVTYKDLKVVTDDFYCYNWAIDRQNSLLRIYNEKQICISFVRLTEIRKVHIFEVEE